jgi:maltose O-acetyltransferase
VIASGVNILDSNGHEVISKNRTVGRDTPKEIVIGENVWIGLNSIILKGTTIGNNSIIAAGSVVKGNIPENVIVQGNPARVIKEIEY